MALARKSDRSPIAAPLLDLFERGLILVLYGWLVARLVISIRHGADLANGLLLVSEGLVVVFLLIRRPTTEVSRDPRDWLLAILATCGPFLVSVGHGSPLVPVPVAASIWLLGTLLQISAKLALGRSFGCVPANRGLKAGGPYRMVRHPMYAGYLLSHVAFLLMNPTSLNFAVYVFCDGLQIPRILVEERLLGRDSAYREYVRKVSWRVLPGIF